MKYALSAPHKSVFGKSLTLFVKTHPLRLGIYISYAMIAGFLDIYLLVVDDQAHEAFIRSRVISHSIGIHHAFLFPLSQAQVCPF